jgi:hypothetical protein
VIPVKDSDTRTKPLALASGHGRCIVHCRHTGTDTCLFPFGDGRCMALHDAAAASL